LAALIELEGDIVPAIAQLFRSEADPDVRAFLVRVAGSAASMFLEIIIEALGDPPKKSGSRRWMAPLHSRRRKFSKFCTPPNCKNGLMPQPPGDFRCAWKKRSYTWKVWCVPDNTLTSILSR